MLCKGGRWGVCGWELHEDDSCVMIAVHCVCVSRMVKWLGPSAPCLPTWQISTLVDSWLAGKGVWLSW